MSSQKIASFLQRIATNRSGIRDISSRVVGNRKIGILGAPTDKGQARTGTNRGPEVIRSTGISQQLQELGLDVKDFGDVTPDDSWTGDKFDIIKNPTIVGRYCQKLSQRVREVVDSGRVCLSLGGDHSIGIGTVLGNSRPDLGVIWVGSHPDVNTTYTTRSGHIHGMPASFVIKEMVKYNERLPGFEWMEPRLTARDVVFIGLRQVDPMERLILQKIGIKAYSMQEIDRLGMKEVVGRALEYINPRGDRPLHVSFDIDVLDRLVAPSTGTPSAGGLSLREALYLAEEIYETGQLTALDLVEVNPDLGSESDVNNTLEAAKQVLLSFFGSNRGGDLPLDVHSIPEPVERNTLQQ